MRDTTQETVTPMSARRRLVRTAAIAAAVAAPLTISAGCFGGSLPDLGTEVPTELNSTP